MIKYIYLKSFMLCVVRYIFESTKYPNRITLTISGNLRNIYKLINHALQGCLIYFN